MAEEQQHPAGQDGAGGFPIPVRWPDLSGMPLNYANQIALGSDGVDLVLTFGQVFPPPVAAQDDAQLGAALSELGPLTIQPVVRIVIPAGRARELLAVLQRGLDTGGEK